MSLAFSELDGRIQTKPYTPPVSPSTPDFNNIEFKSEHSTAFPPSYQYCGYLEIDNNTSNSSTWHRKYFVISNNYLLSAPTSMSLKLDEIIYLQDSIINASTQLTFELITSTHRLHFRCTSSSSHHISDWIEAIQKASLFKIKDIYRFQYILGTSGMTKVVAAKHKTTNEESAIKIVDKRISNKKMLKTEIEILKKLENEFVVNLYDVIETKKYLYIVMERCEGGELFDKIVEMDGDHFDETDCCLIMHQIAKGVKYMHSLGIMHFDLKPENILCVEPNSIRKIKISDFGVSKIFNNETKLDEDEMMKVSIGYTAPEILLKKKYDHRADYWSIGVILYILLCGYPPFSHCSEDENDESIINCILNDELIFEKDEWEHVSNETFDLVKGLLEKDANKRKTCDDILKLVWKVTNSTMSFEKAMENLKNHVSKNKMQNYSFSAYDLSFGGILDKDISNRLKSTSCSLLPGFSGGSSYIQSGDSSSGNLSVISDFVYANECIPNSELKLK